MQVLRHPGDLQVPLYNWQRQEVGSCSLPGDVFNVPVRRDILHRVVRWQLAKRQQVCCGSGPAHG